MTNSLGPKIRSFEITPREIYLSRRHFMGGALATGAALAASTALSAASPTSLSFSQNAFPKPSDAVTDRTLATTYNNFYGPRLCCKFSGIARGVRFRRA